MKSDASIPRDRCVEELPAGFVKTVDFAWLIGRMDTDRWLFQRCECLTAGIDDLWLKVPEFLSSE